MSLQTLWSSQDALPESVKVDVILVGGIDSPPIDAWSMSNGKWWNWFLKVPPILRILKFDYECDLTAAFAWFSFLEKGITLLDCLSREYISDPTKGSHHFIFVSHGLGGFLVKQALCYANAQQQHHRYGLMLSSILGIVLLGVPQAAAEPALLTERSLLMLRMAISSMPKSALARLEEEAHLLNNVSKLFQAMQSDIPILNVFEKDTTTIKTNPAKLRGMFGSRKKVVLVDEMVARIGSSNEVLSGLPSGHYDLCQTDAKDPKASPEFEPWLKFVFSDANLKNVERRMGFVRISASPTISLTSMSSFDAIQRAIKEDQVVHHPSVDATAGSSEAVGWEVVPLATAVEDIRRTAQLPCFMMQTPVRNHDFCSRESILIQLDNVLLSPNDAGQLPEHPIERHAVLYGMGGLGKTSIAIEYAFSRQDKFDAVFWIRADDPAKLEYDFSQIAAQLGLEDPTDGRNPVVSRNLARGWLENPQKALDPNAGLMSQVDAHWLVVFDNADKPDLLQDYCPSSGNGSILITSRDPRSKVSPIMASKAIEVPPLNDDDASAMLRRLSRVSKDVESSVKIVKMLGGLPLAISQMAAVIQHQYMSFSELLNLYEHKEDRKQLQSLETGTRRPEVRGNISTIWFVEQVGDVALRLLELYSVLDPDCIQDALILNHLTEFGQGVEDFPSSRFIYNNARTELIQRALISRNEEQQEFWIHRVLQDVVRSRMSRTQLSTVYRAAVRAVSSAWGVTNLVQRHTISLAESRRGLFPHIISLKNVYEMYDFTQDREISLLVGSQMNEAGWYQHERGNSHDIKPYLFLALDICERFPGPEATQLMSDAHYCLAACANETNDIEGCYKHTSELLRLRQEMSNASKVSDLRLAIAHNEYAIALASKGNFENAIEEQLRSIEVYRQLPEYWPGMDTNPRTNMGFVLWNIGRHDEALETFTKLLRDRELRFGVMDDESFRTGRVLYGLGNVAEAQGHFARSEEWHRKAVLQYTKTVGAKHHKTADAYVKVALHCARRTDYSAAVNFLDQALSVYTLRAEVYKPQIARTSYLKAKVEMLNGNEAASARLFREARDLRETMQGITQHPKNDLRDRDFDELVFFWSR